MGVRIFGVCRASFACTMVLSLSAAADPPRPGAPSLPPEAAPLVPKAPALPAAPTLPKAPALPKAPELPRMPTVPKNAADLESAGEVALAALPAEIKPLIPDPDKLAEWFQGHGGAILGTGSMVMAPLGYVAGGDKNAFFRSHLPGLGLHGQIGLLFLRRYGLVAHGGYAEHLKGSDASKAGSSWQMGLGALFLLKPEEKTPYLELGLNRNSFSNDVNVMGGTATRQAASWDGRLGVGYMVLTKAQKFLYTPWVAVDFGRFAKVTQTLNGSEQTLAIADDNRAWHYIISAGVTFAYHKKVPALMGPPPSERPDDADGDLILDPNDKCPTQKEDYYPPNPSDGCPSDDWDGDGIPNAQDKCPTVPEDGLGPDPKDGCPTSDRDQDGVEDSKDACKTLREDGLGDKPADGCPNSDRDGDGVLDADDRCPDQPETKNGFQDEDGCPDEVPRVALTEKSLTIRDKLFFETGKSDIGAVSLSTIDEIAKVLASTPSVELIEIQGHADNMGTTDKNLRITQARAAAVRRSLIERGVAATRLTAVGYGEYCPIAPNLPDRGGNEQNRRVEFRILRTSSGPTGAESACAEAIRKGITGTDPKAQGPAK